MAWEFISVPRATRRAMNSLASSAKAKACMSRTSSSSCREPSPSESRGDSCMSPATCWTSSLEALSSCSCLGPGGWSSLEPLLLLLSALLLTRKPGHRQLCPVGLLATRATAKGRPKAPNQDGRTASLHFNPGRKKDQGRASPGSTTKKASLFK
eukprot:814196-Prorocentrum_minimum.AAC.3